MPLPYLNSLNIFCTEIYTSSQIAKFRKFIFGKIEVQSPTCGIFELWSSMNKLWCTYLELMRIVEKWCFSFQIYNAVLENRKYSVVQIRKDGLYSRSRPCGIKKKRSCGQSMHIYILVNMWCCVDNFMCKTRYMNMMLFCKKKETGLY